jgi:hypothetical protein
MFQLVSLSAHYFYQNIYKFSVYVNADTMFSDIFRMQVQNLNLSPSVLNY